MISNGWSSLLEPKIEYPIASATLWLEGLLRRSRCVDYLRQFGSPENLGAYRSQIPICNYDELRPWIARIQSGEANVLFPEHPVAYELTGGSAGGSKLVPYTSEGLLDFQRAVVPWLAHTVERHGIAGKAYFSISPATRQPQSCAGIPVGLSDGAFLGETAGPVVAKMTAVPFSVAAISDVEVWRKATLAHLLAANDLELISVWSPTFLLRLLSDFSDTSSLWPRLKVVSCWASGPAQRYLDALQRLFPQANIEAKGLLSTEAVVTVPDRQCRPVLTRHGFVEFAEGEHLLLADELKRGTEYGVVVTTASGLYRYQTGDRVRYAGRSSDGSPILEFVGRDSLTCDLVGEKLTESFVAQCLGHIRGFAMLVPDVATPGYVLISDQACTPTELALVDERLNQNPQYAYARHLGQLSSLRPLRHLAPFAIVEQVMTSRGVRLGDIKPTSLRSEEFWLALFEGSHP